MTVGEDDTVSHQHYGEERKSPCRVQQGFIEPESKGDSKACWDSNVAPKWRRTRRDGGRDN